MLTLNLIRHAKTNQVSPSGNDFDRTLLDKGVSQANILGNYLRTHHIFPGKIICSSATRTQQTCSIICQHLVEQCSYTFSKKLYLSSHKQILEVIESHGKGEATVTIIGHNEGISELASYLSGEFIHLRTSEMISLTFPFESWDHLIRGTGVIIFQYRPEVFLPLPVASKE
ncbi:histidine phosphatase family protein [Fluviicola sp.]|jgi:phosphohistidine phosphatase|uniref:SixA phosphatase family protein n=1 Tax=Fluviicola sp. TaxID=1917219 RepID=UPI002833CBFF|nr:histidine phosphatase family protein [Fluviicola sp.]MDR0801317.1 histidine phosphatase family protein [Fluviicola sp.]